ncbi:MAG UNVERIFIED_CONTAM: hypothetical protein LVR18_19440 [Planctomycetaceae bacterium]|jgi:ribonuclease R
MAVRYSSGYSRPCSRWITAPITAKELRQQLGVERHELEAFAEAVTALVSGGRLREDKRGRLKPRGSLGTITGVLRKITSGAAYVIPSQRVPELHGADVYISAAEVGDAQTGDEVLVRLLSRRRGGGQRCGVIDRVLERASTTFVGTYFETGGQGYVRVDGTVFSSPIHVGDPGRRELSRMTRLCWTCCGFPPTVVAARAL